MAYYATELQAVTGFLAPFANKVGIGYPTGGSNQYYPTTAALSVTTNKSGNANSAGETGIDPTKLPYGYKTWEEKAAATVPPGVFATVIN